MTDEQRELSGAQWVGRFPASRSIDDLIDPFRTSAQRFVTALITAGTDVRVTNTYRPVERQYLMYYAYQIADNNADPETVPRRVGVNIEWVHKTAGGTVDRQASRQAAREMVDRYGIVREPAQPGGDPRHAQRLAIDMTIRWTGDLTIADGNGQSVIISSTPRTGGQNTDLHRIGATYGLVKLLDDSVHWSSDGH